MLVVNRTNMNSRSLSSILQWPATNIRGRPGSAPDAGNSQQKRCSGSRGETGVSQAENSETTTGKFTQPRLHTAGRWLYNQHMKKKCPRTGEIFDCGADTADPKNHSAFTCWCQELPVARSWGDDCLGPAALADVARKMRSDQTSAETEGTD